MDEFQSFLDDWLRQRGWSVNRLADETGISQSLISRWLHTDPRRRVRPTDASLSKLAPVVAVEQHELMRMAGRLEAPKPEKPPLSVQQRNFDQEYDRWMEIMAPLMGHDQAHNTFWDPYVADARARRETLERALYAPQESAVYASDKPKVARVNRVGRVKNADNGTLSVGKLSPASWLKMPLAMAGSLA